MAWILARGCPQPSKETGQVKATHIVQEYVQLIDDDEYQAAIEVWNRPAIIAKIRFERFRGNKEDAPGVLSEPLLGGLRNILGNDKPTACMTSITPPCLLRDGSCC